MWFIDTETFKYDWLMVAINPISQEKVVIVNDKRKFTEFYRKNVNDIWIGFNINGYDQYIIKSIILGFNPKEVNDWIILKKKKGFEFSSLFNKVQLNIYDAMPNIPISLKALEGFLGKNIHETSVPFDIQRKLTPEELAETIQYCTDDVLNLIDVFLMRKNEFDSHFSLLNEFNLPLSKLGKTQAQLAATILGGKKKKLKDEWDIRLPDNLQLGKYQDVADWFLNEENHNYSAKLKVKIGGIDTVIAWGGLHGAIPKFSYKCKPDEIILDADVAQLYPSIMIIYNLVSRAVPDKSRLKDILDTSLKLKKEGKKKEREPYKRICNIVYGASGDKYNALYDPLHRTLTCVYGQVLMIDLIDKIEDLIVSLNFNTDGLFFVVKKKDLTELYDRIHQWELRTQLKMEYDEYITMIQKDVNNYIAIREDGSYHSKGAYVKDLNNLDYDLAVVNRAVRNYLLDGIAVEDTVYSCHELRDFQKVVKLSNKYKWVEHEVGCKTVKFTNKAYRVFASRDINDGRLLKCDGVRNPAKFGNTPDNCFIDNGDILDKPIPAKLDRGYYVELAKKRLKDFGVEVWQ